MIYSTDISSDSIQTRLQQIADGRPWQDLVYLRPRINAQSLEPGDVVVWRDPQQTYRTALIVPEASYGNYRSGAYPYQALVSCGPDYGFLGSVCNRQVYRLTPGQVDTTLRIWLESAWGHTCQAWEEHQKPLLGLEDKATALQLCLQETCALLISVGCSVEPLSN